MSDIESLRAENAMLKERIAALTGQSGRHASALRHHGFSFTQGIIALCFYHAPVVHRDDLIVAIWGDDPDGGPADALVVLRNHILQLRRKFEAFGIRIRTDFSHRCWSMDAVSHRILRELMDGEGA